MSTGDEAARAELARAELARWHARVKARSTWRPVDREIAEWRAADQRPVILARLTRLEHLERRRVAQAVALIGWHEWFAALREQIVCTIERGVLAAWSRWIGLAPPLEAMGGTTVQRK